MPGPRKRLYDPALPDAENDSREQQLSEELAQKIAFEKNLDLAENLILWVKKRELTRAEYVNLVNSDYFKRRLKEYLYATEFLPQSRQLVSKRIEAAVAGQPKAREDVFNEYLSEKKTTKSSESEAERRAMNVVVAVLEKGIKNAAVPLPLEEESSLPPLVARDPVEIVDAEVVERATPTEK